MNVKTLLRHTALGLGLTIGLLGASQFTPATQAANIQTGGPARSQTPIPIVVFPHISATRISPYTVSITGYGFTPGGHVRVRLTYVGGTSLARSVQAGATGRFEMTMQATQVHCAGDIELRARDLTTNYLSNALDLLVGSPC